MQIFVYYCDLGRRLLIIAPNQDKAEKKLETYIAKNALLKNENWHLDQICGKLDEGIHTIT